MKPGFVIRRPITKLPVRSIYHAEQMKRRQAVRPTVGIHSIGQKKKSKAKIIVPIVIGSTVLLLPLVTVLAGGIALMKLPTDKLKVWKKKLPKWVLNLPFVKEKLAIVSAESTVSEELPKEVEAQAAPVTETVTKMPKKKKQKTKGAVKGAASIPLKEKTSKLKKLTGKKGVGYMVGSLIVPLLGSGVAWLGDKSSKKKKKSKGFEQVEKKKKKKEQEITEPSKETKGISKAGKIILGTSIPLLTLGGAGVLLWKLGSKKGKKGVDIERFRVPQPTEVLQQHINQEEEVEPEDTQTVVVIQETIPLPATIRETSEQPATILTPTGPVQEETKTQEKK